MSLVQELHDARKERLARIESKAVSEVSDAEVIYESVPSEVVDAIDTVEEWVTRQRQRFANVPVASNGPAVSVIQRAVAAHYGLSMNDIVGGRRSTNVAFPRMVAVHLCRRLTTRSYPEIGRRFGGRDHTTMIHSDRKITRLLPDDPSLQASVEMLIDQLGGENK